MIKDYKKLNYKMSAYYPPYRSFSNNIKVEPDLANYATKTDLKNIIHVDVSSSASKTNLAALKTEVDKIDTDKLKRVPDDLAKLSNVLKNEVFKKTAYNTLKNKVDAIDTSNLFQGLNLRLILILQMIKLIKLKRKYLILVV